MSDTEVEYINHYKKSIEKNCEDRERVLHCLTRLAKLKVSVNHLQLTGIGKTVNYVKKFDGEVGELAKRLIAKWKDMVAEAEKAENPPVPLFKLPIKLEPEESNSPSPTHEENTQPTMKKSSSPSSSSSETSRSRQHHHRHHSSRSGHSSKDEKKSKSDEISSHSSNKKSSHTKHHKSHHSRSSHGDNSSKRKHEEHSMESKENDVSLKKPKLEPEEIKKESSSKSDKHHKHHHHSKSTSQHKETTASSSNSSSSKPKDKSSKKKKKSETEKVDEEEDDEDGPHGMGFAEALALFDMPSSSKKKDLHLADKIVKVPSVSGSCSKSPRPSKSSRDEKNSTTPKAEEPKKSLKALTAPPRLLTQKLKLEPLPDIVNDLPSDVSIPDYRPLPLSSAVKDYINSSVLGAAYMKPQKHMSDTDLLTESFSSKANRTKVYSGNRVQKTVPSLFEMCIRVLQENIEFLETTGGVPFDILRPVLERAKPEHLNTIEYYNPYLLDESDVLWEPHCKRKFRVKKRLEFESWREMYERCTREDEEKLNRLTQNIKQREETTSNGVQKTMLAFVDSMVKPPRNVMRKQEIFGTNKKLVVSPAARTVGLKHMMPNLVAAGDARLRIAAGIRDDAQNIAGRGMQRGVKKAPMMAKILSKFGKR